METHWKPDFEYLSNSCTCDMVQADLLTVLSTGRRDHYGYHT